MGAVSECDVSVSQRGSPPPTLVATQPAGSAGTVTPSKFSEKTEAPAVPAPARPTEQRTPRRIGLARQRKLCIFILPFRSVSQSVSQV